MKFFNWQNRFVKPITCLLLVTGFKCIFARDRDVVELPVTLSEQCLPMVDVTVNGAPFPCELLLFAKYSVCLTTHGMADTSRAEVGRQEQAGSGSATIASVDIGGVTLGEPVTAAGEPLASGAMGYVAWPWEKMNMVLDLPRLTAWGVHNRADLFRLGFDVDTMERVPCQISSKGVYFTSKGPDGVFVTCLSTDGYYNLIDNSSFEESGEDSSGKGLQIGTRNFEAVTLWPWDIDTELATDVVLGVEFFQNHVVYVDAQEECLYVGERHPTAVSEASIVKVPVEFMVDQRPVIDITVNEQKATVILDTGSFVELTLHNLPTSDTILRKLGSTKSVNYRGEESSYSRYLLSSVGIGDVALNNVVLTVGDQFECTTDIILPECYSERWSHDGVIGHPLFFRTNLFFDLPNSLLWLVDRTESISQLEVDLDHFEKICVGDVGTGIVIPVTSDLGCLRFLVDTGAAMCTVRPQYLPEEVLTEDEQGNRCYLSGQFALGNCDYGEQKLHPLETWPAFSDFDGILGMDFLVKHPFYIDYHKREIYFKRPESTTSPIALSYSGLAKECDS